MRTVSDVVGLLFKKKKKGKTEIKKLELLCVTRRECSGITPDVRLIGLLLSIEGSIEIESH